MKENFSYLKDVLGIRYLKLPEGTAMLNLTKPVASAKVLPVTVASVMPVTPSRQIVPGPSPGSATGTDSKAVAAAATSLDELQKMIEGCTRCKLCKGRKNIVYGSGHPQASLMFVGEGPGEQEDIQGLPFVGMAGDLLTKMVTAMGLKRSDVYIGNVVKCRPPFNRNPEPDEIEQCSPFLKKQIEMINPKVIVALGTFAAQTLLQTDTRISKLRGTVMDYQGRKLIATYHPAFLLRNPTQKKAVWGDLQLAMKELGLKV
jgi:uracil-DNA glycosylase